MPDFRTWLLETRGVSRSTAIEYAADVAAFGDWWAAKNTGQLEPRLLTRMDVADWLREQLDAGLAPATRSRRLASLKVWMLWAMAEGLTQFNPIERYSGPGAVRQGPRWLRREAQGNLSRVMDRWQAGARTAAAREASAVDRAVVALMRYAGLRIGEVASLQLQDLQLSERKGTVIVRHGKGDKHRVVPLHRDVRDALEAWLALRPVDEASTHLFIGKRGPLTANGLWRRVRHLFQMSGIEATPHQLRHTFARSFLDSGGRIDEAQLLLGHARPATTLAYATPDLDDLAAAVGRMG